MVRFVPNPDFNIKDVVKSAKGKFTCVKYGEEFKKTGLTPPDGEPGVVCPKCGFVHKIKC
ncbi:MAG: hypothetical protein NTY86_16235 [Deltaproteobacteria bacterium]|nr:hypothetical protein [Deltaproteobacteria bacterium]